MTATLPSPTTSAVTADLNVGPSPAGEGSRRPAELAALVTCAIAALSFAGCVTSFALAAFVLPGVAIAAVMALWWRGPGPGWLGAAVGSGTGLAWAEVVNIVGGDANGPIARSTFAAAVGTAFAVTLVSSRMPAMVLVPVGSILLSAMVLGASGEVLPVAILTVVGLIATLALAERRRRRWITRPRLWPAVAALALATTAAMLLVAPLLTAVHPGGTVQEGPAVVNPSIVPPWEPTPTAQPSPTSEPTSTSEPSPTSQPTSTSEPTPTTQPTSTTQPTPTSQPSPSSTTSPPPPPPEEESILSRLLPVLLLVLLLALLLVLLWWWRRRRRRALLRKRLESGDPRDRVVGAWVWARYELARRGFELLPRVSPEQVTREALPSTLPTATIEKIAALAELATEVAFRSTEQASAVTENDAQHAWELADAITAGLRGGGDRIH